MRFVVIVGNTMFDLAASTSRAFDLKTVESVYCGS